MRERIQMRYLELLLWVLHICPCEKIPKLYLIVDCYRISRTSDYHELAGFRMCRKALIWKWEMIKKYNLSIFEWIFNTFDLHSCHCTPKTYIMLVCCYETIAGRIILQGQNFFICYALFWFLRCRLEFKWRSSELHIGGTFQNHIHIPASHHSILITCCYDSWHLIIILWVCENPCDWLSMESFHCSYIHRAFSLIIFWVEYFKATITDSDTYFVFRIYTNFPDSFLVKFFLTGLPNGIRHIIIKNKFVIGDKYDIILHIFTLIACAYTMFIKEYNLLNLYNLIIIKSITAKWFYQYFLLVIP